MPKLLSQSELVNYLLKYGYLWTQRAAEIFLSIDRKHFTASSPYDDVPARTLCDQTISAPSIHALSFELLLPKLEVC